MNFVNLFGRLTNSLVTPLKGLTERVENLGFFESTKLSSASKGGEDDKLEDIHIVKNVLDQVQNLIGSWASFCPYDVVQKVVKSVDQVQLGVDLKVVTVMFADIDSFGTICDAISSADLTLSMLTSYFTCANEVISAHSATLLEFLGDQVFFLMLSNDLALA